MRQILSPLDGIRSPFGRLLGSVFSPASLFAASEPGVWYDPSDVANLNWRRNLLTWTEQFDNSVWFKPQSTVTANATTAPDGTLTADKVVETAVSNAHAVYAAFTYSAGLTYTATVYAKAAERSWIYLGADTAAAEAVFFNLSGGGSVGNAGTGYTGTITSVGDGWFRCQVTFAQATALPPNYFVVGLADSNGNVSYLGNGTNGILLWGAQLEVGSTASTYQPITDLNTEVRANFPNATLYQDTAGTTPVTTPGQSVALALDKSKGLVLGSELVTNGDFSGGLTGFTQTSGNVGTSSVIAGELNVVAGGSGSGGFYQDITVVQGATYLLTVKGRRISGSGSVRFQAYDGAAFTTLIRQFFDITTTGAQTTYSAYVRTTSTTTIRVYLYADTSTTGGFDDVSLKLLPGFHATQATAGSRPIYGVVPVGGRRNLLERTEELTNAYYTKTNITLGSGVSDPNGGTAAFTLTSTAANATISRSIGSLATGGTISCFVRRRTGSGAVALWNGTGYSNVTVTGSWARVSVSQVTTTTGYFDMRLAVSGDAVDVAFPQVETGSLSNYQRVVSQYDVTEAGVSSLSYLAFDGVDDFLVTPTITPGIDKVQTFAGVRKLVNAQSVLLELSSNITNTGTFGIFPGFPNFTDIQFISNGSTGLVAVPASTFSAPVTGVVSGIGDISGDRATLRINGTQVAQSTADQGTGNYLAYPMYIGRRAGTVLPFNGNLFSLIVRFGANLTANQITSTETWVNSKTRAY